MALSLIHQPETVEYVFNPFYYEWNSTKSAKLNFKYIADVYVSDSSIQSLNPIDTYVGRFKFPMRPDNQHGILSPSRILESYVFNRFDPNLSAIVENQYPMNAYKIFWGEEYDESTILSAATGTTIYSGLTGTTGYTMNAVKQYESVETPGQYYPMDGALTDWVYGVKRIRPDEPETLQLMDTVRWITSATCVINYASGGSSTFIVSASTNTNQHRWEIPTGTRNLGITDPNITSYHLNVFLSGNSVYSGATYDIDYSCDRFERVRFNWLNKKGGYDYFTFTMKSQNQITRKNHEWEKFLSYSYQIGDRGRTNLYIENIPKIIVTSDWLNDSESEFIMNLFTSPDINLIKYFLDTDEYKPIPVQLTSQSVEKQTRLNNVLVQYTLEFEYAQNIWSQRT